MTRHRVAGVVIHNDKLLVMHRVRDKQKFYVFPGGGIESKETQEQAVKRELLEETSIKVKVGRLLYEFHHDNGDMHFYYQCDYISGEPALNQNSNEYKDSLLGFNFYKPMWLSVKDIPKTTLYPIDAKNAFLIDLNSGFKHQTQIYNIPAYYE
ncbi:MAG: NUDIX domain-containing protein [Patescibacteria group bacterium]|jgi:mutator protein MutT|nr:NUDIX domain-containing protein [Patescibacteria group bacterium]